MSAIDVAAAARLHEGASEPDLSGTGAHPSVPVLELECVTVRAAGRLRPLLDDVTLTLHRGELLVLVDETGAGKGVLAATIMDVLPSTARVTGGAARFNGRDLFTLARTDRRALHGDRIALVSAALLDPLRTVASHLDAVLGAHRQLPRTEASERARASLLRAGVAFPDEVLGTCPAALDHSMLQRVAVAVALVHDPELVIVDDGDEGDATVRMHLATTLVRTVRESQGALLWLTRDPRAAARNADRAAVLYAGRVVEEGRARDVLRRPAHPYTRALLDSVPAQGAHPTRLRPPAAVSARGALMGGCAFRPRCPNAIQACVAAPAVTLVGSPSARRAVRCHDPLPLGSVADA